MAVLNLEVVVLQIKEVVDLSQKLRIHLVGLLRDWIKRIRSSHTAVEITRMQSTWGLVVKEIDKDTCP